MCIRYRLIISNIYSSSNSNSTRRIGISLVTLYQLTAIIICIHQTWAYLKVLSVSSTEWQILKDPQGQTYLRNLQRCRRLTRTLRSAIVVVLVKGHLLFIQAKEFRDPQITNTKGIQTKLNKHKESLKELQCWLIAKLAHLKHQRAKPPIRWALTLRISHLWAAIIRVSK